LLHQDRSERHALTEIPPSVSVAEASTAAVDTVTQQSREQAEHARPGGRLATPEYATASGNSRPATDSPASRSALEALVVMCWIS